MVMNDRDPGIDRLRGLRVLIVEDSYLAASMLKRMLSIFGCEVLGPA